MAKKSMKDAATQGASVLDTLTKGAQYTPAAQDATDVQDVQRVQDAKPVKDAPQLERLNLKIPAEIKAYLNAAAYRESTPTRHVSLTEYLCDLVRADMEKHKDD